MAAERCSAWNLWNSSSPCQNGPTCIDVITWQGQLTCGFAWRNYSETTGLIQGNMQIRLRPDWATFSESGKRRTFAHELGHFLGLDNYSPNACGVSDAIMNDQFDCAAASNTFAPTMNDYLPVDKTVYGGKPRVTCF